MADIVLPQVLVFQEFRAIPEELTQPLRGFIFGPEFKLHRYSVEAEKVSLGAYDSTLGNVFDWLDNLGRKPGSVVDLSYTKVHLDDALLLYWSNDADAILTSFSGSETFLDSVVCSTPFGEPNKIHVATVNLVGKTGYALDSSLYGRDVKVGDYVIATAVVDSVVYTGEGTVIGFEADATAAVVNPATSASTNKATQAGVAASFDSIGNSVDLILSGTYSGLREGVLSEAYTITVAKASVGGAPSTAVLNIVSSSGKDDVIGYQPVTTAWNQDIPLGANGLLFQFDLNDGDNLTLGHHWMVTVVQAFEAPTATSGGTYAGTKDTTYKVTVLEGGNSEAVLAADRPLVQVTTTTGYDAASPVRVEGSNGSNTISVGNHGVTIVWDKVEFCAGDIYLIEVTAVGEGAIRTLVLDRSLPDELLSNVTNGTRDLSVQLHIKSDIELPRQLFSEAVTNWSQTADVITLNSSAEVFDSTWRAGLYSLPVRSGTIFLTWRELVQDHTDKVYTLSGSEDLADLFTTQVTPDNPLAFGVLKAIENSGNANFPGTAVKFMGIPTNDLDGYKAVLDAVEVRDDVYTLVPLTFDKAVHTAVKTHVVQMSAAEVGLWRILFVSSEEVNPEPVITTNTDLSVVLATTDANGYLRLDTDSDASQGFITEGVKPGDLLRINYGTDVLGEPTWDSYVIDRILSRDRLKLVTFPATPIQVASKIEIWRSMNATDTVDHIKAKAQALSSRRVFNVFPSRIPVNSEMVPGYFLCSAIAGLIGNSAPQQGLTNVQIVGFDDVDTVVNRFNRTQLDALANAGVWIVTHDLKTGQVYTRHQLSTDVSTLNTRELSITKNLDSISHYFRNTLARYIGRANVTPTTLKTLRTDIDAGINYLQTVNFTDTLGGQVLEGTAIREIRPHAVLKDRVVVIIDLVLPYPLNNVELHLVV